MTGAFHVQNGQIIAPNGQTFIARGIDLHSDNLAVAAAQVPSQFPGINLIRATPGDYKSLPDPSSFAAAVTSLTSQGIVVEFTDYGNSLGTGSGGGQGYIYTGSLLDTENAWYSAMASFYINNPYVWFGTNNEPSVVYPDGNAYATGPNSLAAWQSASYNAVRSTGNNNPIFLEVSGDAVGNFRGGAGTPLQSFTDPSYIAPMTNVIWDPHIYPYMDNNATDAATNNELVSDVVAAAQTIQSADGVVPVIIGEYGPDNPGGSGIEQVVTAVISAGESGTAGSSAWVWDQDGEVGGPSGDPTGLNNFGLLSGGVVTSVFGQDVANYIATGKTGAPSAGIMANVTKGIVAKVAGGVVGTITGNNGRTSTFNAGQATPAATSNTAGSSSSSGSTVPCGVSSSSGGTAAAGSSTGGTTNTSSSGSSGGSSSGSSTGGSSSGSSGSTTTAGGSSGSSSGGSSSGSATAGSSSGSTTAQTNGVCGSANGKSMSTAPTTGLCTTGTATAVTQDGASWIWQCVGSANGNTAACMSTETAAGGGTTGTPTTGNDTNEGATTCVFNFALGARNYYDQPGGNGSVWNTPLGDGAIWGNPGDADTIALRHGGNINAPDYFGQTSWIGSASDPIWQVTENPNARRPGSG